MSKKRNDLDIGRVKAIEIDGKAVAFVVPADVWAQICEVLEDAEDAVDFSEALASDDGARFPHTVALAIADGFHPIRAWRQYRKLTLDALAAAVGLSRLAVSQIESGKRAADVATRKRLATALGVRPDELVA